MQSSTKALTRFTLACIVAALLQACGGGGNPSPDNAMATLRAQAAQAAPAGTASDAANQLFAFAEQNFPAFFPGHPSTQSIAQFMFRYYPATEAFLVVVVDSGTPFTLEGVYVMGGPFGLAPRFVGPVSNFITPGGTTVTVTGTAAAGAALAGGKVRIVDARNALVGGEAEVAANGTFSYAIPGSATGPFVASVTRGATTLYAPLPAKQNTVVNITPLTDVVAAQLSPTGDPSALAAQVASGAAQLTEAAVTARKTALLTALQPLRDNVADTTDPLNGAFQADGTGHDRLLNSLAINLNPAGDRSNISITVKAALDDGAQAPAITFASNETPPALPASVRTATLPPSDTDTLVARLLAQVTKCYAVPLATRVSGSSVSAADCQAMFSGASAASYKHAGPVSGAVSSGALTVGPSGAFADLFTDAATGTVFDQGQLESTSTTGRSVISFRATAANGSVTYGKFVVARESSEFRLVGNQYDYAMSVRPALGDVEFLASPASSYIATTYNISILNQRSNGVSIFDRVLVTMPTGVRLTFRPSGSLGFLVAERPDGSLSNTSLYRLAAAFQQQGATGSPRQTVATVWAPNPAGQNVDWTDAELAAIPARGTWKAEFFLAGNTGGTPNAVQYLQTFARPFTLAELRQQKWAQFTSTYKTEVTQRLGASGLELAAGQSIGVRTAAGGDAWTVDAGAFAPSSITVIGTLPTGGGWNQTPAVSTLDRSTSISCSSVGDGRCAAGGGFAQGVLVTTIGSFAYDSRDRERSKSLSLVRQ